MGPPELYLYLCCARAKRTKGVYGSSAVEMLLKDMFYIFLSSSVAEHLTVNQGVLGSNPSWGANTSRDGVRVTFQTHYLKFWVRIPVPQPLFQGGVKVTHKPHKFMFWVQVPALRPLKMGDSKY